MVRRFFFFSLTRRAQCKYNARYGEVQTELVKIRFSGKLDAFFREKVRNAYIIVKGKRTSKFPQDIM